MCCLQRFALLSVLALSVCTSTVFANKGPTQFIKFVNNTSDQIGVTPDGTNTAILSSLSNSATAVTNFTAVGGRVLTATGSTTFSVQVGTYTVLAADMSLPTSTGAVGSITQSVTVGANQTVTVNINSNPGAFPPIKF